MFRYIASLPTGRIILWCYLIWYLCLVVIYFDPSPVLWASSLGMSGIVGLALVLSTGAPSDGWTTFRLFLMPFCVSSYSALIKGSDFILIFPPRWQENMNEGQTSAMRRLFPRLLLQQSFQQFPVPSRLAHSWRQP